MRNELTTYTWIFIAAATQRAMNRQNRMNTNSMAAAATNRINPNFPPVNSQFPGAVGRRTMPVNVGTPQGMARGPMPPNFGAFQGSGGRAMPSSVGAFPGSGGGAAPSNVGAFPGGQTNADMSANQIVPSNVDMFPGIGSSSSTDGSTVTNELPGEISAFPGKTHTCYQYNDVTLRKWNKWIVFIFIDSIKILI